MQFLCLIVCNVHVLLLGTNIHVHVHVQYVLYTNPEPEVDLLIPLWSLSAPLDFSR